MKRLYGLGSPALRKFSAGGQQCSLSLGASGIAYALARVAEIMDDPDSLAAAAAWIALAERRSSHPKAFTSLALRVTPPKTGFASLAFAEPGLFYVKGIVRSAEGDSAAADISIRKFLSIARRRLSRFADVYSGGLGLALAAKRLMGCTSSAALRTQLARFSRHVVARAWATPRANIIGSRRFLGFAHGVAGLVFTTYACGNPGKASPALENFRRTANRMKRGVRWPVYGDAGPNLFADGWCNGVAGHLLMWTKVWQISQSAKDLEMLHRIAWGVWESGIGAPNLCCGAVGQAIILASFSSAVGDRRWRVRAVDFLESVPSRWGKYNPPQSLFRGKLGLLLARVECEWATRPLFPAYGEDVVRVQSI
jgi:lantibiotic modifying enzyme